eukprot:CAMPEP_0194541396 /NCGR_PEP_ID=MMETSP0253-20130528/82126_1 /TAXON_ID=2966 /ORGANISM="Noctiluca scintillans" /LENGTH=187 /DNA_ID=CAMNT_0039387879 /DNA_START=14 /DNA_END=578 /DNA_ORIENTATION=+
MEAAGDDRFRQRPAEGRLHGFVGPLHDMQALIPKGKFQDAVIEKTLEPRWNHTHTFLNVAVGDELEFTVFDWDRGPQPDDLLGRTHLDSSRFLQTGFEGALSLRDSGKQDAYLHVNVTVSPAGEAVSSTVPSVGCELPPGPSSQGGKPSMVQEYGKKIADGAAHGLGAGMGFGAAQRIWSQIDGVMQ